jgi:parvulin-like peptidyl-prolyl isomerase
MRSASRRLGSALQFAAAGVCVVALGFFCSVARAQQTAQPVTIDRIVARVDIDIILLSDERALQRYQQLVDGKSETDAQVLDRLIDQWIVRNEADTAQFPHPTADAIDKGVERVQKSFTSPEEFETKKKEVGLTDADVRKMVASQMYLSNYLDSRFRPSTHVEPKDIQEFYEKAVIPRAQARGQEAPSLDAARDVIRDALIQRSIDEQADRWLAESRSRIVVEKMPEQSDQPEKLHKDATP